MRQKRKGWGDRHSAAIGLASLSYREYHIKDDLGVDFFTDERGSAPVEEYLTSLPVQHRAKMLALIKMLEQEDPICRFLILRKSGGS
jgi:hypothetical protein